MSLKVFVFYHDDLTLGAIEDRPFIEKHNLNLLPVGDLQRNCLAESRFLYHLSENIDLLDADQIGICSAKWNEKYPDLYRVERLDKVRYDNKIFAAKPLPNWVQDSENCHPGMGEIIHHLSAKFGMRIGKRPTVSANNFLCSRLEMQCFLPIWRSMFDYCWQRYGEKPPIRGTFPRYDASRNIAYVLERVTMLYFSSREVHKVPSKAEVAML